MKLTINGEVLPLERKDEICGNRLFLVGCCFCLCTLGLSWVPMCCWCVKMKEKYQGGDSGGAPAGNSGGGGNELVHNYNNNNNITANNVSGGAVYGGGSTGDIYNYQQQHQGGNGNQNNNIYNNDPVYGVPVAPNNTY